jgi:cytoskeleton protein RodZ
VEAKRPDIRVALGQTLRQARERRGLSIDDVAQSLRLSARIVAALEDDAFERLPGPTYVRGYLRNYAQFLELAPQPLIDAYGTLPQAARRTELSSPAPVRQVTSSDMMVRLGTGVVALVMFGLAALWWIGHEPTVTSPRTNVSSAPPASGESQPAAASSTAVPGETPTPTAEAVEPQQTVAAPPAAEKPAPSPPVATASEPAREVVAPPAPDPNIPLSHLVLYVREDSWADVRDAQQRRLLYETIPAGRVVTVDGVAPLSVFLGNVEGVTVEFNGEPYDAMRHKRGQVARFTLGSPPG